MPQAVLTDAGSDHFEQLCQIAMGMSAQRFLAFYRWAYEASP